MHTTKSIFNKPIFLSILSGLLLFAAWPVSSFVFCIFFAFIPLLHLSSLPISKLAYFGYIYLAMLIFNISTTWWIWYASEAGAYGAFIANSLLMTIPWLLYRSLLKVMHKYFALVGLIALWLTFEYLHLKDWGLSWPWLTIGNAFSTSTNLIQWYSYTGVAGGTLWVLGVNALIYIYWTNKYKKIHAITTLTAIVVPIVTSSILYNYYTVNSTLTKSPKYTIAVAQPNIDPYLKINEADFTTQLNTLITTSKQVIDSTTTLLLWPETGLYRAERFDEATLKTNEALAPLFDLLKQYPKLKIYTGIESYRIFNTPTVYSRTFTSSTIHYESYNGSILLDSSGVLAYYHKTKLVPGAETMPNFLNFLDAWVSDFGGTTNGYAPNLNQNPLVVNTHIIIAPSICYESIYGAFMSKYVHNGANLISIITNDGWWRNTPGYKQHQSYAALRAIENGTWVARSANTGISCFISPQGTTTQQLGYGVQGALQATIPVFKIDTFYTSFPNLLYHIFSGIAIIIAIYFFYLIIKKKDKIVITNQQS